MEKKDKKPTMQSQCEMCAYYDYDEEWEEYVCIMNMDEDEMARFMTNTLKDCPYFQDGDEYKIVRKQN